MKDQVDVLTFDLYGTVVDMQSGLIEVAAPYLKSKGWTGNPNSFVTWWRRTHFENSMIDALVDRGHTLYREIGHSAVAYTLERAGIAYTMDEVRTLVASIERLRPFDDVIAALKRLKGRYRLAILSNGDPDMLKNAAPYIGFDFDEVISIAAAGYFKPHFSTYRTAADVLKTPIGRCMHVANHAFDCIGAKAAGMKACFIDRRRRPYGASAHQPDMVVSDFKELADVLA